MEFIQFQQEVLRQLEVLLKGRVGFEESLANLEEGFGRLEERQTRLEEVFVKLGERQIRFEESFAGLEERQNRLEKCLTRFGEKLTSFEKTLLAIYEQMAKLVEFKVEINGRLQAIQEKAKCQEKVGEILSARSIKNEAELACLKKAE